ncbi:MAG: sialidase family protein [Armatimonadota bacterium]
MREILTAIQGVCAWPNLTLLPSGELLAMIFNQPCHGMWEGDLDCWASAKGGRTWSFRGRPAVHEPDNNRMNCAAGLTADGEMIVLCSGWSHRGPVGEPRGHGAPAEPLRAIVSHSSDAGRTWQVRGALPAPPAGYAAFVPFGHILTGRDSACRVAAYTRSAERPGYACWMLRSEDGNTWTAPALINPRGDEADILHLGDGRWISSSRQGGQVNLFRSDDDGATWQFHMPVTLPGQVTSNLIRLRDGRLLLSYGNRCRHNFGVDVRVSADEGMTWGAPVRIADTPLSDCGYPSTVQLADGTLVTAFYTQLPGEYNYEMRVALWDESELA